MNRHRLFLSLLLVLLGAAGRGDVVAGVPAVPADPLFDLEAIMRDPVETVHLDSETVEGITFQTIEFTSRTVGDRTERIRGIYAFPAGGSRLPGLFWSMGGMAAANRTFPGLFAKRGWACLAITLPHEIRNSFRSPFLTADPREANLTLLARDQLRAITVLSQQPEVDPDRLAVAGASYGGFFATLIAGVDPRIKAGMSFFGGGWHERGTALPQFLQMASLEDVAIWNRTIDPAVRLRSRPIPFMWGVAFNDHWFHFPAVIQTFLDAAGDDKRVIIIPHWQHGFPPAVDETLTRFLDTTPIAPRPIPPYNRPGPVRIRAENGRLMAAFDWDGERPVREAELVVSYGEIAPWLAWPYRAAFVFPAAVTGRTAEAILPLPSRRLPLVVWGTVTDSDRVSVSTPPCFLETNVLAGLPLSTPPPVLNAFPFDRFDPEMLTFYRGCGDQVPGQIVTDPADGVAIWRIGPPPPKQDPALVLALTLFHHVPGVAHRFAIRIRSERPATVTLALIPRRPSSWRFPLVRERVRQDARLAPLLPSWEQEPQALVRTAAVETTWTEISLEVPSPEGAIEGYRLEIREPPGPPSAMDIATIRMEPLWPEP